MESRQVADTLAREWDLPDPALTADGVEQCKALATDLRSRYSFPTENTLIVVSPLRRTLQSFQLGLGWLRDQGVRVELRAEWQESTDNPCDVGTEPLLMAKEWPDLDFSDLDPVYPGKTGLYDPSEEGLQKRAQVVRQWLFQRPEKFVVVMTHSGFLRRVVDGNKYKNMEYRVYDFDGKQGGSSKSEESFALREVDQGRPVKVDKTQSSL